MKNITPYNFDRVFSDETIKIGVNYHGNNFIIGTDNELIKLKKICYDSNSFFLKHPHDISVNDIWSTLDTRKKSENSLFGLIHIVNCSFDDPKNFQFELYGMSSKIEWNRDFAKERIGSSNLRALIDFGAVEYDRVKKIKKPDLTEVKYEISERTTSYRKLMVPLSTTGCEVTHLLVGMTMQEV